MFRLFCLDQYYLILNNFSNKTDRWISISPTTHSVLAHSWELIERNSGVGAGELSESGLESKNKYLRSIRTFISNQIYAGTLSKIYKYAYPRHSSI